MNTLQANFEDTLRQLFARHQSGDIEGARRGYLALLPGNENVHDLAYLLGMAECQLGNPVSGIEMLTKAIQLIPHNVDAYFNRAVANEKLGKLSESLADYTEVINRQPGYVEAHYNRANIFAAVGDFQGALNGYDQAITLKSDYAQAYNNRGIALRNLGLLNEAIRSYEQAIALHPGYIDAFNNRGTILRELGRPEEALVDFDYAIRVNPEIAEFHFNRAIALQDLRRFEEALQSYDQVIRIFPQYPGVFSNRGAIHRELGHLESALKEFDAGLELNPSDIGLINNRAVLLQQLGRFDDAQQEYDRAIQLQPDYAQAHWNKGYLLLLMGALSEGYQLLEWRFQVPQYAHLLPKFVEPKWSGKEDLNGKTIFVYSEQDPVDILQHCRLIPMLESLGAKVVFEVPKGWLHLLESLQANITLIEKGDTPPPFDFHIPLLSLPFALKLDNENLPNTVPYLFTLESLSAKAPKKRGRKSALKKTKRQIGLLWSVKEDEQLDVSKSIPLELFESMLNHQCDFHSLQQSYQEIDRIVMEDYSSLNTHDNELENLDSLAKLIDKLDLVISADGKVAHLAAAMGKEVWLLISNGENYRWQLDIKVSPWYPTMKIYRKNPNELWGDVIKQVEKDLVSYLKSEE
jgi:tetratricopeptide (TPR) repeat protein